MYYLLEDNRIYDSEKMSVRVNEYQGVKFLARDSKNRYCLGKIKKQSENVYDFIDWEKDLVRITGADKRNFIIDCNINKSDFFDGYYSLEWITAIYKPDEKGNYIKVWEKKEDE